MLRLVPLLLLCGWVTSFPDLKVKLVTALPDLEIEYVTSFPGVP